MEYMILCLPFFFFFFVVSQVEQILNVAWKDKTDKSGHETSLRERLEKNYNEILRLAVRCGEESLADKFLVMTRLKEWQWGHTVGKIEKKYEIHSSVIWGVLGFSMDGSAPLDSWKSYPF